ncbi:MAG: MoxR family ATPase [Xanthomonadales bacterium]|nr:MoxR family ATPase [Xanthomonadales bacterium]MDH3925607.1 MoxR family ATPase [Xanthomonadales bacterium]MDH3939867.1 MoxR family ATPase [Xanthomonadales bacterium]MDH4000985.1 MoxR family ATPase [Xanthomonadales bacterium]
MSFSKAKLEAIIASISSVLMGKEAEVRIALACLLAQGHLLIEDLPGLGKTTLANAIARVLGLEFNRVQFTSDLLPADIVGVSIYEKNEGAFRFLPGPVFCQLLLADEINRTTPKTQSALLEAMAEGQVTVEGQTRPLPAPFFVIATQNPIQHSGTFPLPESQLDRFLMRLSLGYPDLASEKDILTGGDPRVRLGELKPMLSIDELLALQAEVDQVSAAEPVVDYLQRLIQFTRTSEVFEYGLSPRAGLAILQSAKAISLLDGRAFVIPEDIQVVFPAVANHRLQGAGRGHDSGSRVLIDKVLDSVDVI